MIYCERERYVIVYIHVVNFTSLLPILKAYTHNYYWDKRTIPAQSRVESKYTNSRIEYY